MCLHVRLLDCFGAGVQCIQQCVALCKKFSARTNHVRMEKSREQLKRLALAQGIYFETGIPVSGKREAEDRAKYKQQLDARKKAL